LLWFAEQPQAESHGIEQDRRTLARHLDDVARLAEAEVPPSTFFREVLQRLVEALAATAGAVWLRTAHGNLQQQFQINMQQVGLDASEEARASHEALLRLAFTTGEAKHLPPRSATSSREERNPTPGNMTG
jgi:hypothetical protein